MKFRPLHDRVVVKRIDAEEKSAGGIIIPDTAKEKPSQGEIIAVGPGGRDEAGKLVPLDVQVGKELPVVLDGPDPEFANHVRGRTTADAPEIDCAVRVKGKNLRPGDLVRVKVTAADGYDLAGRAIGDPR